MCLLLFIRCCAFRVVGLLLCVTRCLRFLVCCCSLLAVVVGYSFVGCCVACVSFLFVVCRLLLFIVCCLLLFVVVCCLLSYVAC